MISFEVLNWQMMILFRQCVLGHYFRA